MFIYTQNLNYYFTIDSSSGSRFVSKMPSKIDEPDWEVVSEPWEILSEVEEEAADLSQADSSKQIDNGQKKQTSSNGSGGAADTQPEPDEQQQPKKLWQPIILEDVPPPLPPKKLWQPIILDDVPPPPPGPPPLPGQGPWTHCYYCLSCYDVTGAYSHHRCLKGTKKCPTPVRYFQSKSRCTYCCPP